MHHVLIVISFKRNESSGRKTHRKYNPLKTQGCYNTSQQEYRMSLYVSKKRYLLTQAYNKCPDSTCAMWYAAGHAMRSCLICEFERNLCGPSQPTGVYKLHLLAVRASDTNSYCLAVYTFSCQKIWALGMHAWWMSSLKAKLMSALVFFV